MKLTLRSLNVKGWKTPEFWVSLLVSIVSILAMLGILSPNSLDQVKQYVGELVSAVFIVIGSLLGIWHIVKDNSNNDVNTKDHNVEDDQTDLSGVGKLAIGFVLCTMMYGTNAYAQQLTGVVLSQEEMNRLIEYKREYTRTCLWLRYEKERGTDPKMMALLERLAAQQERMIALMERGGMNPPAPVPPTPAPPASPPIIIIPPGPGIGTPRYELPPGGTPRYELPPGGTPKYELPPGGAPRYELPPSGSPRYELPPGGVPKYDIIPGRPGTPGNPGIAPKMEIIIPPDSKPSNPVPSPLRDGGAPMYSLPSGATPYLSPPPAYEELYDRDGRMIYRKVVPESAPPMQKLGPQGNLESPNGYMRYSIGQSIPVKSR